MLSTLIPKILRHRRRLLYRACNERWATVSGLLVTTKIAGCWNRRANDRTLEQQVDSIGQSLKLQCLQTSSRVAFSSRLIPVPHYFNAYRMEERTHNIVSSNTSYMFLSFLPFLDISGKKAKQETNIFVRLCMHYVGIFNFLIFLSQKAFLKRVVRKFC